MSPQNATAIRQYIRYGYLVLIAVAFVYALAIQWDHLRAGLTELGIAPILWSLGLATAGVGVSGLIWLTLIRSLGATIGLRDGGAMFFITQLGKYVPGSLWPVVMQADYANRLGIPVRVAVMAQVLFMWVYVVSAAAIGFPLGVMVLVNRTGWQIHPWAMCLAPVVLVLLHPHLTQAIMNGILRILRRDPLPGTPGGWAMVKVCGLSILMWGLFGGHLFVLVRPLLHHSWIDIPALDFANASVAFAAAWLVGFVVVIAPAGVGPRELVLIAAYPNWTHAVLVAAISRVVLTLADGFWALTASLIPTSNPATSQPPAHLTSEGDR